MTGRIFYTSDTHFGHRFVAGLRGYTDTYDHDEAIVTRWNKRVAPDDVVWHLGDVTLGRIELAWPYVDRLNGVKHLIAGNHDAVHPMHADAHRHQREWLEHFASVQAYAVRRFAGSKILVTHLPYDGDHTDQPEGNRYAQFRLPDLGWWNFCGHVHGTWKTRGRQINVGLDQWDMTPVPQETLFGMITDSAKDATTAIGGTVTPALEGAR